MPSHRKEPLPEPRHRAPRAPRRQRWSAQATALVTWWPSRVLVVRMLVVTPQFAAGAGIVIAAVLAVDVPHAALSYGPNPEVSTCSSGQCTSTKPSGTGGLTTSDPGIKIKPPRHHKAGPAAVQAAEPAAPGGTGAAGTPAARLGYRTIRHVGSGFVAMITVTASPKVGSWRLGFAFPAAKVQHVWGDVNWRSQGRTVVVSGQPWPWPGQKTVTSRIVVFAAGTAAAPDTCTFNGAACSFG